MLNQKLPAILPLRKLLLDKSSTSHRHSPTTRSPVVRLSSPGRYVPYKSSHLAAGSCSESKLRLYLSAQRRREIADSGNTAPASGSHKIVLRRCTTNRSVSDSGRAICAARRKNSTRSRCDSVDLFGSVAGRGSNLNRSSGSGSGKGASPCLVDYRKQLGRGKEETGGIVENERGTNVGVTKKKWVVLDMDCDVWGYYKGVLRNSERSLERCLSNVPRRKKHSKNRMVKYEG